MNKLPTKIAIVGTGRVAEAFLKFFSSFQHIKIVLVGRNKERLLSLNRKFSVEFTEDFEIPHIEWSLVAVSDSALHEVIPKLKSTFVSITSGIADYSAFKNNCSIFYPLQTFSFQSELDFSEIPIIIDGDNKAKNILKDWGAELGLNTSILSYEEREKLHLVAVFLNNFVHHLMAKGINLAKDFNLNTDLFKSLLKETFNRFDSINPYAQQTGPAIRNDEETIEKHRKHLTQENLLIYDLLTKSIKTIGHGKL